MQTPPLTDGLSALLLGADQTLRELLSDILLDVGVALRPELDSRPSSLVLLLPRRGIELWKDVREVTRLHSPTPVVVLLPFADERLEEAALRNGAQACCSLWENLDAVRRVLRAALDAAHGAQLRG